MSSILDTLKKRKTKFESAQEELSNTNKELTALYIESPKSIEEQLTYEARVHNILLKQQKNLANLEYRAKKYHDITDHDDRQICRGLRIITEAQRKQIKDVHGALKTLLKKDLKTELEANQQMLDQNGRNSDYVRHILKFNQAYNLFQNECESVYNSNAPHEVQENIASRSKELQQQIDLLGPLSASSNLVFDINWETERQNVVRQSDNIYFFKDDYSKKYAEAILLQKEFLQLSDLICDPNTSDDERSLTNQKLELCRNNLSSLWKELQEGSGRLGIDIDWASINDNLNHRYEDVQFNLRTQGENLSELNVLFQNQPSEYLHKSHLYQFKLIRQKQFDDAVNYGLDWIKSMPNEASSEDIIEMSFLFIQAAETASKPNWVAFRQALDVQLKQRDLRLTDQKLASHPELKSADNGKLELVRGTLFAKVGSLSFSAGQSYRYCEMISPNEPSWKFLGAQCDISAHQWPKAMAIIPSLPPEAALAIRKSIAASQSNAYFLPIDFCQWMFQQAPRLFPKLEKSRKFRTAEICIQVSTRYFKELCVPRLTIDPKWPEKRALCLLGINQAIDILDCFHERIPSKTLQQRMLFGVNIWRVGSSLSQFTQPEALSVFSVMNTASTFASVGLRYPQFRGHTFRAICITTQKIQTDIVPMGLIDRYWTSIVGYSKQLAIKSGKETQFDLGSDYLGKFSNDSRLLSCFAVGLLAAYRFATYYPQIRTAIILSDAQALLHQERYQESKTLLREAQNSWYGDIDSIQLYADYIDSLETVFKLIIDQELGVDRLSANGSTSRQKKVADQVLKTFGNIRNYSGICEGVYYNEVMIALKLKDKERVKELLKRKISIRTLEQTVVLFIHYVEAQSGTAHKWVDDLFPQAYKDIVSRYREYISERKNHPILTETSPQDIKDQRLRAIDALLPLIKYKDGLDTLYVQLLCDQFFVYFDTENDIHKLTSLLTQMSTAIHKKVALILIEDAEHLYEKQEGRIVSPKLRKSYSLSSFQQKNLIEEYEKYLSHRKTYPQLTRSTAQEKDQRLKIIDSILSQIESDNSFSALITELRCAKVRIYLDTESYKDAVTFLKQVEDEPRLLPSAIMHLVQSATVLCQIEGKQKATDYLAHTALSLKELPDPNMVNVLELFCDYLVLKNEDAKSYELLNKQIVAMNKLLDRIRPIHELSTLYVKLSCEQFAVLINVQRYDQAKPIFDQHLMSRQVRLQFVGYLAEHFIQRGDTFIKQKEIDKGEIELLQLSKLFGISKHNLIRSYVQFLDCYKVIMIKKNIDTSNKALESINNLSEEFIAINYPIPDLIKFQESQINIMLGTLEENNQNYESALKAYQSAKDLYLEIEITDHRLHMLMINIDSLEKKIKRSN